MIDEEQVRSITKKVLDEEHLLGYIKIFEKEHNLFRGSHDKIKLPAALNVPDQIINQININSRFEFLEDVSVPAQLTGDFLQYDEGIEKWKRMAALTQGSIIFPDAEGYFTEDNTNLNWDNAAKILSVTGDTFLDGAVVINDANADKDFRVEGSGATYTHLLFTDAGNNRVGINEDAPKTLLHVRLATCADYAGVTPNTVLLLENEYYTYIQLQGGTSYGAGIVFTDDAYNPYAGGIQYNFNTDFMHFYTGAAEYAKLSSAGFICVAPLLACDVAGMGVAARIQIDSNEADCYYELREDANLKWTMGFDYNDSFKFQIAEGAPGTNVRFEIVSGSLINLYLHTGLRSNQHLRFYDNGNYVGFVAPPLDADQIWMLPTADAAQAGSPLVSNASGILSWAGAVDLGAGNFVTTGTLGCGLITTASGITNTTGSLTVNDDAGQDVTMFASSGSGENRYLYIYGYGGSAAQYGRLRVDTIGAFEIDCDEQMEFLVANTRMMNILSNHIRIFDDVPVAFGGSSDYSIGYYSADDELQIINGTTLDSNVRAKLDASGNWDFVAGNIVTTGTLGAGAATIGTLSCGLVTTTAGLTNTSSTLTLNDDAGQNVTMFASAAAGENPVFYIYGDDAGAPKYGSLQIAAGGTFRIDSESGEDLRIDSGKDLFLNYSAAADIYCFSNAGAGENPYFYIYGRGSAANEWLRMRVESDNDALIESEYDLNINALGGEVSFGACNLSTSGTFGAGNCTVGTVGCGAITCSSIISGTTAKLSNLTDGYIPYHVADATGLANSPIHTNATQVGIGTTAVAALSLALPGSALVGINTPDDNNYLAISGSDALSADLAPAIILSGVSRGVVPGTLYFYAGNVAGGDVIFHTNNAIERMRITYGGNVFIGDTANTNMTQGLTINQGANDDEILALKSSDVAHGITDITETDTYVSFKKVAGDTGGAVFYGLGEGYYGHIIASIMTSVDTDKDATAVAPCIVDTYMKNGAGVQGVTADGNLFVVKNAWATRFIVDEDGDIFYDGGASSYQEHDDIALLAELEDVLSDKISKQEMKKKDIYKKHKIVYVSEGLDEEDSPFFSRFVSTKKKNMLVYGAIRQLSEKIEEYERLMAEYEPRVEALLDLFGL